YHAAIGEFELTVEKLKELVRYDLDVFKSIADKPTEIPIDISTDLIIELISSVKNKRVFLAENELLSLVLKDISVDKKYQFRFADYFEKCQGRAEASIDTSAKEGIIKKVEFEGNKFYYAIEIKTGRRVVERNSWGGNRSTYTYNTEFDRLKEDVKKLSKAKWNANEQHWGVPMKYEAEITEFAKRNNFYL